jgi:flavin-dependent dehydrogenase
MKNLKIAIIGAGACGLYLAWKLSQKGQEVTVFEKRGKIGKEACSGLFSQRILGFVPQSQKLIKNQIGSTLINFPGRTFKIKFSKKMLVMNHWELDKLLASLAKEAGAKIVLNHSLDSLPTGFDRIIGCDGSSSIVRKSLGLKDPHLRLGIQGFVAEEDNSDFVETWALKKGFLWKVPRGKEVEYGVIAGLQEASKIFEEFIKERNIKLEEIKSALIPQGLLIPTHSSITLCGDSAGLTKPWSGGGVVWGLTAANILLKNFPDFLKYKKGMKRFFLPKIISSKVITKLAYFLGFKAPWFLPKNLRIESDFLL